MVWTEMARRPRKMGSKRAITAYIVVPRNPTLSGLDDNGRTTMAMPYKVS